MQRGQTAEGYVYYRCRANGGDVTVYEHQLVALLDNDAADVFDSGKHVHHRIPVPEINTRRNLDVVEIDEHAAVEEHVENIAYADD